LHQGGGDGPILEHGELEPDWSCGHWQASSIEDVEKVAKVIRILAVPAALVVAISPSGCATGELVEVNAAMFARENDRYLAAQFPNGVEPNGNGRARG
jgi:hypothetical protein